MVWTGLLAAPVVAGLFAVRDGKPGGWLLLAVSVGLLAGTLIGLRLRRVTVDESGIEVRTLLGGTRRIDFTRIRRVEFRNFQDGYWESRLRPPIRLVVTPIPGAGKPLHINLKSLPLPAVKELVALTERFPGWGG